MTLAEKLKACRKELGLTQIELANLLGIGVQSVYRYEAGERVPKVDTLEKIANAMKKPVSYFTDDLTEEENLLNTHIARMSIKAQDNEELAKIIEKLNGMSVKQFNLTYLFVKALTDDFED